MTELMAGPPFAGVRNVVLCDERPAVSRAISERVTGLPEAVQITCVTDAFGLADAYIEQRPDLVLVSVRRGRTTGLEATALLLGLHPSAVVIAYGSAPDVEPMAVAVARGARGLMVWDPVSSTGTGVPAVASLPTEQNGRVVASLTERELQVLRGMSGGRSNGEIGRELYLSEDTIKTHARRLFGKLGARDRAHAVLLGLRHNLLT
jgi:DNA-binding NarL/FixJ family response regulator